MNLAQYLAHDRSRTVSLAAAMGNTPAAVRHWANGTRSVPATRCVDIEAATSGQVTRYELRPDVFGEQPQQAQAA